MGNFLLAGNLAHFGKENSEILPHFISILSEVFCTDLRPASFWQ
jgi:hypothetical protein